MLKLYSLLLQSLVLSLPEPERMWHHGAEQIWLTSTHPQPPHTWGKHCVVTTAGPGVYTDEPQTNGANNTEHGYNGLEGNTRSRGLVSHSVTSPPPNQIRFLGVLRPGGCPKLFVTLLGLFLWCGVAAHIVLLGGPESLGYAGATGVFCFVCRLVWVDGLCHLASVWRPWSRVSSRKLHRCVTRWPVGAFSVVTNLWL